MAESPLWSGAVDLTITHLGEANWLLFHRFVTFLLFLFAFTDSSLYWRSSGLFTRLGCAARSFVDWMRELA